MRSKVIFSPYHIAVRRLPFFPNININCRLSSPNTTPKMYTTTVSKAILLALALTHHALSAGTQFITGPCASDADCASSCCGFNSGLCAGPVIAQTRDGGCGHGDAQPNAIAADAFFASQSAAMAGATSPATAAAPPPAATTAAAPASGGSGNVGTGTQFITGACTSDADCASGCCVSSLVLPVL